MFVCSECADSGRPHHAKGLCNSCYRKRLRSETSRPSSSNYSDGGSIEIKGPITTTTAGFDPNKFLTDNGLAPSDWFISRATLNTREGLDENGDIVEFFQVWARVEPKPSLIIQPVKARGAGWTPPKREIVPVSGSKLVGLIGDLHFPEHEPTIVDGWLQWLSEFQPHSVYYLGDLGDYSSQARHRKNPRKHASMERTDQMVYNHFCDARAAAPNTRMIAEKGNHCNWPIQRLLETNPELATYIAPGDTVPYFSAQRRWRLDELDIETTEGIGEYHDNVHEIVGELVGFHGTRTGRNGGAISEVDNVWESSVIQFHDHKQSLISRVKRVSPTEQVKRWAFSPGAACKTDLGYSPSMDVAQGWGVITVHDDGRWHPEVVSYDPEYKDLTWRDWRYTG